MKRHLNFGFECVCKYVCLRVCVCVWMGTFKHRGVCMYLHVCMCVYIYMNACVCVPIVEHPQEGG